MDVLTALLACNLYTADEPLVRAIAQTNSHGNPYAVVDAAMDYTRVDIPAEPRALQDAEKRLADITGSGGRPLLGLMQIPPAWLATFGRETPDAFDACINVSIGSAMLSSMDHECAAAGARDSGGTTRRRRRLPSAETLTLRQACVVRKYGETIGMPEFELLIRLELGVERPRTRGAVPLDAPIMFADATTGGSGSGGIFVHTRDLSERTGTDREVR
jgi:hypothetical protein